MQNTIRGKAKYSISQIFINDISCGSMKAFDLYVKLTQKRKEEEEDFKLSYWNDEMQSQTAWWLFALNLLEAPDIWSPSFTLIFLRDRVTQDIWKQNKSQLSISTSNALLLELRSVRCLLLVQICCEWKTATLSGGIQLISFKPRSLETNLELTVFQGGLFALDGQKHPHHLYADHTETQWTRKQN